MLNNDMNLFKFQLQNSFYYEIQTNNINYNFSQIQIIKAIKFKL